MTTPPMSTTGSFQGTLHPHQVAQVLNMLVSGSPFSGTALTPYPTNRSAVAFPTAKPDRPAWLGEGEDIPVIGLGDDADIVAVCKLASIVLLSNEGFSDALGEHDRPVRRPAPRFRVDRAGPGRACTAPTRRNRAGWWPPRLLLRARTWPPR